MHHCVSRLAKLTGLSCSERVIAMILHRQLMTKPAASERLRAMDFGMIKIKLCEPEKEAKSVSQGNHK